jgi:hypothetical protein
MKNNQKTENLIITIRELMETMCDEERIDLINCIMDGYCKYCGGKDLPCYCWNDD